MALRLRTQLYVRGLLTLASATVFAATAMPEGRDGRMQERLYDHLASAEKAYSYGHTREATAYAEMILLRRAITVYVDEKNVPWQSKDEASKALRDSMVNWEDALKGEVKFRIVSYPGADVTIKYAGEMRYDGKHAAGTARWSRSVMSLGSGQYEYQVSATITLRTHTPQGSRMNYRQMLHTAGHELGHVLGLEDSARQGELMGPLRLDRPVERATSNERESLLSFREQADLILQKIAGTDKKPAGPTGESKVAFQVVSFAAETIEPRKNPIRVVSDRRGPDTLRGAVRNRKAPSRASSARIGGLAR